MATLLLNLNAPMQSWGTELNLKNHETNAYPTKSGVIGMIASALGIKRNDDEAVAKLAEMRFGVRVEADGELTLDWQTVRYDPKEDPKVGYRYYLSDAGFVCGIEGERGALEDISWALRHPANALFLGRRSCPVTADLVGYISDKPLEEALKEDAKDEDRIIVETTDVSGNIVRDVPISFSFEHRKYGVRFTKEIETHGRLMGYYPLRSEPETQEN